MKTVIPQTITLALCLLLHTTHAVQLPQITNVEPQPFIAATQRLLQTLTYIGAPLTDQHQKQIHDTIRNNNHPQTIRQIQTTLDHYTIAQIHINPQSRVQTIEGPAPKKLIQQGWRTFLIKIHNQAAVTAPLIPQSPNAAPQQKPSTGSPDPPIQITPSHITQRFLDLEIYNKPPQKPNLTGLNLEYRIFQIYTRDTGKREAQLSFHVGQGTQDIGHRNTLPILFDCQPAIPITLHILDHDNTPTTAALTIRDHLNRIYPNPARRQPPDFFFQPQIYRTHGQTIHLPPGQYTIHLTRGPEYHPQTHTHQIQPNTPQTLTYKLQRWIHPKARNWISGDHHIHAAGCSHYENPTHGIAPQHLMPHILGEDLNIACILNWGPCWYHQKNYFQAKTSPHSQPNHLMRYDIEISGFPSSHAGHLCLLNLTEDDYPNTTHIQDWPSWTLPILQWAKQQNAITGYAHTGWGLALPDYTPDGNRIWPHQKKPNHPPTQAAHTLPDYAMPPFDGIGANEYIVAVTHNLCDFISVADTPPIWELNIWYHTLNTGFRTKISGETDFPCIYDNKIGLGRTYVQHPPNQPITFQQWTQGLKNGRSYCGDGMSHIFDLKINNTPLGQPGNTGINSQHNLPKPDTVTITFQAAALLQPKPTPQTQTIRQRRPDQKPYWHIERARINDTRKVPIEIILNGHPIQRIPHLADGTTTPYQTQLHIPHSSWLAVRILPSVHTNPIFIQIADQPIQPSRRSAQWCLQAVNTCWNTKQKHIRPTEKTAAQNAYNHARQTYTQIIQTAIPD